MEIGAFRALRPRVDLAGAIGALPYDVVTTEEARRLVDQSLGGYSFLQIDKPELLQKSEEDDIYKLAGDKLSEWMDQGIMVEEDQPALYIYTLDDGVTKQMGLVCLLACNDYEEGRIKKHEHTREDKERERISHIEGCSAHTGPIFLVAKDVELLGQWMDEYTKNHEELYVFTADTGVKHSVHCIKEPYVIKNVQMVFQDVSALYIADGHHRCAAANVYAKNNPTNVEAQKFLGVIFPQGQVKIMDYNRVVKNESHLTKEEILSYIGQFFQIEEAGEHGFKPEKEHELGMRLEKRWYRLSAKTDILEGKTTTESLDVSLLQDFVLSPLFSIENPRRDPRIDFVGGVRGIKELERRTEEDMDIAFSLYPARLEDLMSIADEKKVMPPKSTWFEPKLLSGLFIHCI